MFSARAASAVAFQVPPDGASKARTVLFFGWKASTEDDAHDSKERSTQEQQLHGLSLSGAPDKGTGIRDCFRLDDARPSGWGSMFVLSRSSSDGSDWDISRYLVGVVVAIDPRMAEGSSAAVDKPLLAFLNGISKRLYFGEVDITDQFLREDVLGGITEEGGQ